LSCGDAKAYCSDLNLAGYDDWQMPTIREASSIIKYDVLAPKIDTNYFPETFPSTHPPYYVTSTEIDCSNECNWAVNFQFGTVHNGAGGLDWIRCVREE